MNDSKLTAILDACLDQIAGGKTIPACLAQHPEHAAELAPMLAVAGELASLRHYRLSETARQRAHVRLLRAEVARNAQHARRWWQPGSFAVSRLAAGLAVALVCVILTTGMVAASQPGDLAYGVRVLVEQAPAWLARGPENRARAELGIAARRLTDLDRTMNSQQQDLDQRTLAALLSSAERAAALAESLPEAEQAEVAARLAEQARHIAQLGQTSRSAQNAEALRAAAERAQRAAERIPRLAPPSGPQPATSPGPGSTGTLAPGDHRTHTPTAERTPSPGPDATQPPASRPARTATPPRPDSRATAPHDSPSTTPAGPMASPASQGPGPSATAPSPGPIATPQGPGPSVTPQGLGPVETPQGPGPGESGGTGEPGGPGEPGGSGEPGGTGETGGPGGAGGSGN